MNPIKALIIFIMICIPCILMIEAVARIIERIKREKIKKKLNEIKSITVELYDILVVKTKEGIKCLSVLKDEQNKLYVQSPNVDYGLLDSYYASGALDSKQVVIIKNLKRESVEFGTKGKLYIEEKSILQADGRMLLIESYYVCFKGTIDEYPQENIIYSVKNEYLSKELKNATIFRGITIFDKDEVINEYFK